MKISMVSNIEKVRAPSRIEFHEGLGVSRPVVRLRGNGLGVEVRETALHRFDDYVEVGCQRRAVVDGVIQRLRVHASELSELIGPEHGNHLPEMTATDILVEPPDPVLVDPEGVEIEDAREAAIERVRIDLLAVLQQLHADDEGSGVAAAHREQHVLNRHVQRNYQRGFHVILLSRYWLTASNHHDLISCHLTIIGVQCQGQQKAPSLVFIIS